MEDKKYFQIHHYSIPLYHKKGSQEQMPTKVQSKEAVFIIMNNILILDN